MAANDQSWLSELLKGDKGNPGPQGPPGLGGFLTYSGSIVVVAASCAAGQSTFFSTFGLSSVLALRTPDISADGNTFAVGDGGRVSDVNPASLHDVNGYLLENPLDGGLYATLNWGPGSGGAVANPNLAPGDVYGFMRLTVTTTSGPLTYWKHIL